MASRTTGPSACGGMFFFFNDTATTEIYTLSLHDALPISQPDQRGHGAYRRCDRRSHRNGARSEEHTSELQPPVHLACRLLLEQKNPRTGCNTHRLPSHCPNRAIPTPKPG